MTWVNRNGVRDLPLLASDRDQLRAELQDHYARLAHRKAVTFRVSLRCGSGDHKCHNSGISCLCWCHDRKSPAWEGAAHAADR